MILDEFRIDNKVAIVTGASRGIGQAMAVALAEAGADVAVVGHKTPSDDTVDRIVKIGRRCIPITADLANLDNIEKILKKIYQRFGRIDILVNNAGIIRRQPALDHSIQDWDDVLMLNLKTVFFLCQAVARRMIEASGGKIINIASLLSYQGGILVPSYAASKSGIAAITKALANEWARYGINVNAIAPGWTKTDMTAAVRENAVRNEQILARIPAGRWGNPEDLKGAVVFLASSASDYMHGHILCVDGGYLAY